MNSYKNSLVLVVLTFAALMGCFGPAQSQEKDETEKPLIYGIHVGKKETFWGSVEKGAQAAAEKYGYNFIFRGAGEQDQTSQSVMFDIAINSGAKGIFVAPNSEERSKDVERAKLAGVPVVYIDRMMGDPKSIVSFIGTNNYAAGELAAHELIKKIGEDKPAKVIVFPMSKDVVSTSDRERGFIDTLKKKTDYKIIITPYITAEIGKARSYIGKYAYEPENSGFDAIFTPNENTTVAAILSLAEMESPYVHIGFDSGPIIESAIRNGDMYATIIQSPFEMGYHGVKALHDLSVGNKVEAYIESGVVFVTKDNIDDLSPDNMNKLKQE